MLEPKYIIIFLLVFILFKQYTDFFSYRLVFALCVAGVVAYIYYNYKEKDLEEKTSLIQDKLSQLPINDPTFISKDIDIIQIYFDLIESRDFNKQSFDASLKHTTNFLTLFFNEYTFSSQILDNLKDQYKQAINNLMSIIISIPSENDYYAIILRENIHKLRAIFAKYLSEFIERRNAEINNKSTINIYDKELHYIGVDARDMDKANRFSIF